MQPRNPYNVIDTILKHVPQEYTFLYSELEKIKTNIEYTPPESIHSIWTKIAFTLQLNLNMPPKHDWEKAIHNILRNNQ